MKKVKEIYFLETYEEKSGNYSDGFLYIAEDGTKIYTRSTDIVAHDVIEPKNSNPQKSIK